MDTETLKEKVKTIVQMAGAKYVLLAVALPNLLYLSATLTGSLKLLFYTHILTGGVWTGFDIFMGFVLGPVLGSLPPRERASVFKKLTPKTTFLLPVLAGVSLTSGVQLALRLNLLHLSNFWAMAALILAALLTLQGFGVLLPNGLRILGEILKEKPDIETVSKLGMRNARLGGIQGLMQIAIIFVMANLRGF